jgi:hypothetical protein
VRITINIPMLRIIFTAICKSRLLIFKGVRKTTTVPSAVFSLGDIMDAVTIINSSTLSGINCSEKYPFSGSNIEGFFSS